MSLTVEFAGKTDIGCVRANNEDNFGYDARHGIFVVCDGMGGQAAGEVASKMGVDTILTYFRQADKSKTYPQIGSAVEGVSARANRLGSAIRLANEAVHQAAQKHAAQAGMGSTVVAVLVDHGEQDGFYSIGHVGDSRVYRMRGGKIEQLTQDHSLVMEQVRRGLISLAEAQVSEMQNIIIKALGPEASVEPDLDDEAALPGDVLVLCSDGLTRHVPDDSMEEVLNNTISLQLACERLVDAAKDGGGQDNITCVILRFVELPWYKKFFRALSRLFGGGRPQWQNSI
ncbi:MAG TPA: protein phosphatase 2C domain-containing protein [Terriglobales bacterium]|nr:protein phosphatase 2C domain-containing protein [Terriglobales bacterium]